MCDCGGVVVICSHTCLCNSFLGVFGVCSLGGEMEDYVSVFIEGVEEFPYLGGEGDHTLCWRMVFVFGVVCFLACSFVSLFVCLFVCLLGCFFMSIMIVCGEDGCFVGGDDVEGFPRYRVAPEGVQCVSYCKDGPIVWVTCT